jgi:hypothetical protein
MNNSPCVVLKLAARKNAEPLQPSNPDDWSVPVVLPLERF